MHAYNRAVTKTSRNRIASLLCRRSSNQPTHHLIAMNQTSRTDEPYEGDDGLNQSPNALSNDLTTNQDLNGIANSRTRRSGDDGDLDDSGQAITEIDPPTPDPDRTKGGAQRNLTVEVQHGDKCATGQSPGTEPQVFRGDLRQGDGDGGDAASPVAKDGGSLLTRLKRIVLTFGKFVGPGFMVSVAYSGSLHISPCAVFTPSALFSTLVRALLSVVKVLGKTNETA